LAHLSPSYVADQVLAHAAGPNSTMEMQIMANYPQNEDPSKLKLFDDCPEFAFIVASLLQKLGGSLTIDSRGTRGVVRPECLRLCFPDGLPQLPSARPHEQLQTEDQWRGAFKLLEYCLSRLSDNDNEMVFGLFASPTIDSRWHSTFGICCRGEAI
jgi:hypothetical protein